MKRSLAIALVAGAIVVGGGTGWALAGISTHTTQATPPPRSTVSTAPVVALSSPGAPQTVRASNGDLITTSPAGLRIVRFSRANGDIRTAADVTKLHLTSDEFRGYIRDQLASQKASCPNAEITVDRFALAGSGSPHSFAVGAVGGCGGAATLWSDEYGEWKQLFATQDTWYCQVLQRYHVPDGLIDGCVSNPGTLPAHNGPVTILSLGVYAQKQSDANRLTGTSQAFRDFIGTMAQTNTDINTTKKLCAASGVGITVNKYATNSYAIGSVNDCGGYVAIWGDIGYGWQELIGSQAEFDCQQLHDDGVPVGLVPGDASNSTAGMCLDSTTRKSIPYAG